MIIRNLNQERFADVTFVRICKECKIEKNLKEFPYHSATNFFLRTCQSCVNQKKRIVFAEKAEKEGRSLDKTHTTDKFKTCRKCNMEKELFKEFPKRGRAYSNICKQCVDIAIGKRKPLEYIGDIELKICNLCKVEKLADEFSKFIAPSGNVLLKYCCKSCDNQSEKNIDKVSRLYTQYRYSDINKGLEFNLSKEFIKYSLEEDCTYCSFPSTGLDRIENNIGHTIENCIPCCWECNTARMHNFTYEEMLLIGKTIGEVKLLRNKQNINGSS